MDRSDEGLTGRTQRAAQLTDEICEACLRHKGAGPDLVLELTFAERTRRVRRQDQQELKRLWREVNRLAVLPQLALHGISNEVAEAKRFGRSL